jgi:ribonuclease HI
MGAREVEAFGDSKLVVQQINEESQCLDGLLNEYHERCVEVLNGFEKFSIRHVPRRDNSRANLLAQ